MRTEAYPRRQTESWQKKIAHASNRDGYASLEAVDRLLKRHGLEIVFLEGGDLVFKIEKIIKSPEPEPKTLKRYRGPEELPVKGRIHAKE